MVYITRSCWYFSDMDSSSELCVLVIQNIHLVYMCLSFFDFPFCASISLLSYNHLHWPQHIHFDWYGEQAISQKLNTIFNPYNFKQDYDDPANQQNWDEISLYQSSSSYLKSSSKVRANRPSYKLPHLLQNASSTVSILGYFPIPLYIQCTYTTCFSFQLLFTTNFVRLWQSGFDSYSFWYHKYLTVTSAVYL